MTPQEKFCPTCSASYGGEAVFCEVDGAQLVPLAERNSDPLIGRVIAGRFEVVGELGVGGMGAVYRAIQRPIGREVALKVMKGGGDTHAAKRFIREAKLASQINHPNTVTLIDFGQAHDGSLFLAMELVEGQSLKQRLAAEGALEPTQVIDIARQICDGLAAAHRRDIIHRDLKPGNIMLGPGGRVKVVDFGLAKSLSTDASTLTRSNAICGTLAYIAPESARGDAAVAVSDLYSLGVMMFEMIEGRLPFSSVTAHALLLHHVITPAPELSAGQPPRLRAIIGRLLAKDCADRFSSADDLNEALADALKGWVPGDASAARPGAAIGTAIDSTVDHRPSSKLLSASTGEMAGLLPRRLTRSVWLAAGVALLGLGAWWAIDASTAPTHAPHGEPAAPIIVAAPTPKPTAAIAPSAQPASPADAPHADVSARPAADGVDPAVDRVSDIATAPAAPVEVRTPVPPPAVEVAQVRILSFTSQPTGASVFVGAREVCQRTPCEWTLGAGAETTITVTMRKRGRRSRSQTLDVIKETALHLSLPRIVQAEPSGSDPPVTEDKAPEAPKDTGPPRLIIE